MAPEPVVFYAHVDRTDLSKPPIRRGESLRFWNAVCQCDECVQVYARVRVTVEVIDDGE